MSGLGDFEAFTAVSKQAAYEMKIVWLHKRAETSPQLRDLVAQFKVSYVAALRSINGFPFPIQCTEYLPLIQEVYPVEIYVKAECLPHSNFRWRRLTKDTFNETMVVVVDKDAHAYVFPMNLPDYMCLEILENLDTTKKEIKTLLQKLPVVAETK